MEKYFTSIAHIEHVFESTQREYAFKAKNKLSHHVFDGKHRWDGATAYDFVGKWL
ncbi:MAG: hypothetical protein FWC13_03100 [Oscillospiraceae bacterium]|nr:hypothetical protein [Oscillospiraceae bacterium]